MKKLLLIKFLILTATLPALSQVDWGVKAGVLSSNHSHKNDYYGSTNMKSLFGFQVGTWLNTKIARKIQLLSELTFSREGYRWPSSDTPELQIPINWLGINSEIRYGLTGNLYLLTGPEIARLISAKLKTNDSERDFKFAYHKYSVGWNFDIYYEFSNTPISLSVRYHLGLRDIWNLDAVLFDENGEVIGFSDTNQRKMNFQLNLYYKF